MPIATRLTNTGTLLVNGNFDENTSIAPAEFRTDSTAVYAGTIDEISIDSGAISFNGTSQYLTVPTSSFLTASNTYTIEFWMYAIAYPGSTNTASLYQISNSNVANFGALLVELYASGNIRFEVRPSTGGTNVVITSSSTVSLSTWTHVAVSVNAGSAVIYINGVSVGTGTVVALDGTQTFCSIGYLNNGYTTSQTYYNGYISNLRVVKATAVYTAAFTPSQSALTAVSGTSLLLNVTSNTNLITDGSPNNLTLTNNNSAAWALTGPFNRTITIPSLYASGSLSFNGTNQYLSIGTPGTAFAMGTGDFTVEAWIYVTSTASADKKIFSAWGNNLANAYTFSLRPNNRLIWQIYTQNSPDVAGLAIQPNTWTHVAWSKSGTTSYLFINGVLSDTTTGVTNSANGTGGPWVGAQPFGTQHFFPGYITNVRVVKGTALYTSSFTVSTAPLTAVSGTSLLLKVSSSSAYITDSSTNNFTLTNNNSVAYSGTITPLPGTPNSRQLNDGTLQVPEIFDEFTGAPVVDGNVSVWLDAGQTSSYPGSGSTWTDLSGNGRNATLFNSPVFSSTTGPGILTFDGVNEYATFSLDLSGTNFSINLWYLPIASGAASYTRILSQGSGTTYGFDLALYTGRVLSYNYSNSGATWVQTSITLTAATWVNLCFVKNGTAVTIYKNGVSSYTGTMNNTWSTNGVIALATTFKLNEEFNNCSIEALSIYNRVLTADETVTNFNALRGRFGI